MASVQFTRAWPLLLAPLGACTTLGPMPGQTGLSYRTDSRAGVEVQGGAVPGYFLSETVKSQPRGASVGQTGVMVEPGKLVGAPGLGVGARYLDGADAAGLLEPMLRYRTPLQDGLGMGATMFGSHGSGEADRASFAMTRYGLEVGANARLTPPGRWSELHLRASFGLTGLDARGSYCVGDDRFAMACSDGGTRVSRSASGLFPSLGAGLSYVLGPGLDSAFHGLEIAVLAGGGQTPRLREGDEPSKGAWYSGGFTLTIALGEAAPVPGLAAR